MKDIQKNKPSISGKLKLVLKIGVSIACLWYVFRKINFLEIEMVIKQANPFWLLAGFFTYLISKYFGARRLLINFNNIGIQLPPMENIKLYWLGMFYNLFLPGSITGDAYKVVLLSKKFGKSYKKLTSAVILDRFSGLLSLGLMVAIYGSLILNERWLLSLLFIGSIGAIPLLFLIIKRFFPDFLPGFWPTFFWGAAVQFLILVCVYTVLFSLQVNANTATYVFIFLIAIIASVLPISVGGGLGVREFAIIEGANYAGLGAEGQHTALVVSLLFYLITVVSSLIGISFSFKNIFAKKS